MVKVKCLLSAYGWLGTSQSLLGIYARSLTQSLLSKTKLSCRTIIDHQHKLKKFSLLPGESYNLWVKARSYNANPVIEFPDLELREGWNEILQ